VPDKLCFIALLTSTEYLQFESFHAQMVNKLSVVYLGSMLIKSRSHIL